MPVQNEDEEDIICYLPNAWEDVICHLPNLKNFTYRDTCNYLTLKNVAKFCPNIETIDIGDASSVFVLQESVKRLCRSENGETCFKKLKKLYFTHIVFEDLKILVKNLPSLEIVDYPYLPLVLHSLFENDELHSLGNVRTYNITSLDLNSCVRYPYYNDILKVCLSVCPHLKSLTYGLSKEDDLITSPILSKLEQFEITNFMPSEVNIDKLVNSRGKNLTSLTIDCCAVSLSVIAESCPHLEELTLHSAHFLADDDSKLAFKNLASFNLIKCNAGARNSRAINLLLSLSPKLESLVFEECYYLMSSDVTTHIQKCCEACAIKNISFNDSNVDVDYIKYLLSSCHTLNSLNIDGCFSVKDSKEIIQLAETLPNKPKIVVHVPLVVYDSDMSEILDGSEIIEIDSNSDVIEIADDSDFDIAIENDDSDVVSVTESDDSMPEDADFPDTVHIYSFNSSF